QICCPDCGTTYRLPEDRIGRDGRKVRCVRCGSAWRATGEAGSEEVGRSVALAPAGLRAGIEADYAIEALVREEPGSTALAYAGSDDRDRWDEAAKSDIALVTVDA